jgi:hypothetical protein
MSKKLTIKHPWYVANTGNHQGLIVEEITGKNIAVCYDKKDTAIIAAAPAMYTALRNVLISSEDGGDMEDIDWSGIRAAVAEAEKS